MSPYELHELLIKAVEFVPEDDGADETTDVTVNLADLRGLVEAAWTAAAEFERAERETTKYRELYRSAAQRLANQK